MHRNGTAAHRPSLFERLLLKPWEYRHRRLFWGIRVLVGLVLLGLGVYVVPSGGWWALAFMAAAAADFVLGYRFYRETEHQQSARSA